MSRDELRIKRTEKFKCPHCGGITTFVTEAITKTSLYISEHWIPKKKVKK